MKASDARQLKIGDWVQANFGGRGVVKNCEIIAINWPTFKLRTKDHRGDEMIRTRRYQSLTRQVEPNGPSWRKLPYWLIWPDYTRTIEATT